MTLAIDFDGVIHDPTDKAPGYKMGKPLPGAQLALKILHDRGATLIIHTLWAREPAGKKACEQWLNYFGFTIDEVTALKPKADIYIDDRGYHFTTWLEALAMLDTV